MKKSATPLLLFLLFLYILLLGHVSFIHTDSEALLHFGSNNINEAFQLARISYFEWNPRIGDLLYYFCDLFLPIHVIEMIVHPLLTLAGMLFIYRVSIGKWPDSSARSLLALTFIIISIYGFHSGIYWLYANFSWFYFSISALALIILTENWFRGDFKMPFWKAAIGIPLAFIVGMSQENTPAVMVVLLAGCGIYWAILKRKGRLGVSYWLLIGFLLAGAACLYLSPAREARAAVTGWEFSLSTFWFSLTAPSNWIYFSLCFLRPFLIGLILIAIYIWKKQLPPPGIRTKMLTLSFFLLWGVLIAAPCWGAPRGYMPMDVVLCCLLVRLFYHLYPITRLWQATSILVVHVLIMATIIVPSLVSCYATHQVYKQISSLAAQARAKGEKKLIIRRRELDRTPFHITPKKVLPNFILRAEIKPSVPLVGMSQQEFAHYKGEHIIPEHFDLYVGDTIENKAVARPLGLDAIIYIQN